MTLKKFGLILLLIFSILPMRALAQTTNAGFVPGNIWYSKDPFSEGDKIKIYTLIFNPDIKQLSGTVLFFDNSTLLGKKDFIVVAKGVKDVSIDWNVTVGDHLIFAKIENSKFLLVNGKSEDVYLAENKTAESKRTVSKKITGKTSEAIANIINTDAITNLGKIIEDKTPNFIAKPLVLGASIIEDIRSNLGKATENKKQQIKKDLNPPSMGKASTTSASPKKETSFILKPIKYVELFFVSIFSFIFNNKYIFYGLVCLIIFLILRFIWRLIF